MKVILFALVVGVTVSTSKAQPSSYVTLYLKLENSNGVPLAYQEITLHGEQNTETVSGYTHSTGRVQFRIKPNDTYYVSFPAAPDQSVIAVPKNPGSNFTKVVVYDPPSTALGDSTRYDTVVQSLIRFTKPTYSETALSIYFYNERRRPHRNLKVWLAQPDIKKVYEGVTNTSGEVYFLVPNDFEYSVNVEDMVGLRIIKTLDYPNARDEFAITYVKANYTETVKNDTVYQELKKGQGPTQTRAVINIYIRDLNNQPLEGEKFYAQSRKTGKVYFTKTNETGTSAVLLPKDDIYDVSFQYDTAIDSIVLDDRPVLHTISLSLKYIGSVVLERMKAERARLLAERDSLFALGYLNYSFLLADVSGEELNNKLRELDDLAKKEKEAYEKDPLHFVKAHNEVAAVLARMGNKWQDKIIVTDVTGSMNPYLDKVLIWHAMELIANEQKEYFFFNDGDEMADEEKMIGQTGGIYFTPAESEKDLYLTMLKAKLAGYGGDGPENDLEALLKAQDEFKPGTAVILIADNYSDVKDLELLSQLKVPVHIICCGVSNGIHPHYLQVARKTGGSVHTIEEDIDNLANLLDGSLVTFAGQKYQISHGRFIRISDM